MKVYISGKVTGLPYEEAWMNFQVVEEMLREEGYDVVNPLKNGLNPDDPWTAHMKEDIKLLMGCDAIYMIKGWEESRGSCIEHVISRMIGILVLNEISNEKFPIYIPYL